MSLSGHHRDEFKSAEPEWGPNFGRPKVPRQRAGRTKFRTPRHARLPGTREASYCGMELEGLEPSTSAMPWRRSPS
jgi:hypothetical protein